MQHKSESEEGEENKSKSTKRERRKTWRNAIEGYKTTSSE